MLVGKQRASALVEEAIATFAYSNPPVIPNNNNAAATTTMTTRITSTKQGTTSIIIIQAGTEYVLVSVLC